MCDFPSSIFLWSTNMLTFYFSLSICYKHCLNLRALFCPLPYWLFWGWVCWWNARSLYKSIPNNLQAQGRHILYSSVLKCFVYTRNKSDTVILADQLHIMNNAE